MWLSVDPMADKYPSLSAYNYCAWNPVMLVDPDGMEIEEASAPPGKLRDKIRNFFRNNACANLLESKNPNKEPVVFERTPDKKTFWKRLKSEKNDKEDTGESFVISPKRETRIKFDARSVPDALTVFDDDGETIIETGPVSGRRTFDIPKGVKKIRVQVEANKEKQTHFKYRVEEKYVQQKTITWEWKGIIPRRRVNTINLK